MTCPYHQNQNKLRADLPPLTARLAKLPVDEVGEPISLSFWREGREATRAEILHSIDTGLPFLRDACQGRAADLAALDQYTARTMKLIPA